MVRACALILFAFVRQTVLADDHYPRNPALDIRHYQFNLILTDSSNLIIGEAKISIRFRKAISDFELDLVHVDADGQGMHVTAVRSEGQALTFSHAQNRLMIHLAAVSQPGEDKIIVIQYRGIPKEGLIIGHNKFGDRTFFGENWPDRARHWLPTIDHPYDKATCEFIVTAPEHYTVIATGEKLEESAISGMRKITHWKTSVPLPTKVMVMGAARFAIEYSQVNGVSLQTWVYPQNRLAGFSDYAVAAKILDYFSHAIAPYPYEKLANVQSTTGYGGMENASNIFYAENSVTGKDNIDGLMAHEIAHQWFGDSATENDWYHVWLSEGLSTYYSHLFLEHAYGVEKLKEQMRADRGQVIAYYRKSPTPIVNTDLTDINRVLNTNVYQKASWVLHMLRHEVGDQAFAEGVRDYYRQFQFGNAMTDEFRASIEKASGKDLKRFFDQWFFQPGHPTLAATWTYDDVKKKIRLEIVQNQKVPFDFSLDVGLQEPGGTERLEKVRVTAARQEFMLPVSAKPSKLTLDPGIWLLYEGSIVGH